MSLGSKELISPLRVGAVGFFILFSDNHVKERFPDTVLSDTGSDRLPIGVGI